MSNENEMVEKHLEGENTSTEDTDASEEETEEPPFSVKTWKEDLTIIVENKKLYVNKATLALLSPVFDKMFSGEFKEKGSDELQLPDKQYETFVEFLQCIYPGDDQGIVTAENAYDILPLADEYQIENILSTCDGVLARSLKCSAETSDVYKNLNIAITYRLEKLQDKCIELASERTISEIMTEQTKHQIPLEIHEKVLVAGLKRKELDITEYKVITDLYRRNIPPHQMENISKTVNSLYDEKRKKMSAKAGKLFDFRIFEKINSTDTLSLKRTIVNRCSGLNENDELFKFLPVYLKEKIRRLKTGLKD